MTVRGRRSPELALFARFVVGLPGRAPDSSRRPVNAPRLERI
ncbi:hypothetical protein [Streptomyces ardesiacus]